MVKKSLGRSIQRWVSWSLLLGSCLGPTRFHQYTEKYKTTQPVEVITAGCLGGKGTEWLVGGGFLPDGKVVVVGNALGPTLNLPGVKVNVIGQDAPAKGDTHPQKRPQGQRDTPQLSGCGRSRIPRLQGLQSYFRQFLQRSVMPRGPLILLAGLFNLKNWASKPMPLNPR